MTAVDCGDVAIDEDDHAGNRDRIRQAVATLLDRGLVPLVLGGDDSVPIPVLEAYAGRGPLTILQIDAHIDWRDEVQGERLGLSSTMRRASEMAHVGADHPGRPARDRLRPGRRPRRRGGGRRPVRAGARAARPPAWRPCWTLIPPGADIFVAFDVDALDPATMPAVIGPAPGGLTYLQAVDLLAGAAQRGRIVGFDLVEFMAERDQAESARSRPPGS